MSDYSNFKRSYSTTQHLTKVERLQGSSNHWATAATISLCKTTRNVVIGTNNLHMWTVLSQTAAFSPHIMHWFDLICFDKVSWKKKSTNCIFFASVQEAKIPLQSREGETKWKALECIIAVLTTVVLLKSLIKLTWWEFLVFAVIRENWTITEIPL